MANQRAQLKETLHFYQDDKHQHVKTSKQNYIQSIQDYMRLDNWVQACTKGFKKKAVEEAPTANENYDDKMQ